MNPAYQAAQAFFYFFSGLGIFFIGIGVLWFISIYQAKNRK